MIKQLFDREVTLHSQPATRQDEWVLEVTGGLEGGYFVEIGAHDGLRYSNTLTLENHFGWTGLLVEPLPDLAKQCRQNRPKCQVQQIAVGPYSGSGSFVIGGPWSGFWQYMPESLQAEHQRRRNQTIPLAFAPLWAVLDEADTPEVIDYLSIDTEGSELAILRSAYGIPPYRQIRCLTVEILDPTTVAPLRMLLEPHGLVLDQVRGWDACFRHKDLT